MSMDLAAFLDPSAGDGVLSLMIAWLILQSRRARESRRLIHSKLRSLERRLDRHGVPNGD